MEAFIADCKEEEGGILHIDATGSEATKNVSSSCACNISIVSDYGTLLGSGSGLSDEQTLSSIAQQNTGKFVQ